MIEINYDKFIELREIENNLNFLLYKSLSNYAEKDGVVCKKCGIIQGMPHLGWSKYYCTHIDKQLKNKLTKERKDIIQNIMNLTLNEPKETGGKDGKNT